VSLLHTAVLVSSLGLVAALASAQTRPLRTEEATTAPAGTLVLETGVDYITAEPNFLTGAERDRYAGPLLRLVYSPADNVEMDLEWAGFVGARDPDFGSTWDRGDVTLRAKVRFLRGGPKRPALGARFWVTLPETKADVGLGPNALRQGTEALFSQALGRVTLHANAGFSLADEVFRSRHQRDFLSYGLAVTRTVGSHGELVAEGAGRAGKGFPGSEEHSELRAGFRWRHGPVRYDMAVRRGLETADGRWGVTVGLAWTIRPRPKQVTDQPAP
jgi:hypothetical protein